MHRENKRNHILRIRNSLGIFHADSMRVCLMNTLNAQGTEHGIMLSMYIDFWNHCLANGM